MKRKKNVEIIDLNLFAGREDRRFPSGLRSRVAVVRVRLVTFANRVLVGVADRRRIFRRDVGTPASKSSKKKKVGKAGWETKASVLGANCKILNVSNAKSKEECKVKFKDKIKKQL